MYIITYILYTPQEIFMLAKIRTEVPSGSPLCLHSCLWITLSGHQPQTLWHNSQFKHWKVMCAVAAMIGSSRGILVLKYLLLQINLSDHCMDFKFSIASLTPEFKMIILYTSLECVDSFAVPLHSPYGRQMPAVRAVQRDCRWGLKNLGNSHRSREPIMQWDARESQSIFRPANHKRAMTANWMHVSYPPNDSPTVRFLSHSQHKPPRPRYENWFACVSKWQSVTGSFDQWMKLGVYFKESKGLNTDIFIYGIIISCIGPFPNPKIKTLSPTECNTSGRQRNM